jgi:hypothetical protein
MFPVLRLRPVVGYFAVKLQEKNRSMPGDVITIIILLIFVETVRSDDIKGLVSAKRFEKIADIDTGVSCRCVRVWITLCFHGHRRQCQQLIVAVVNGLCWIALGIKRDHFEIQRVLRGLRRLKGCCTSVSHEERDDEHPRPHRADNWYREGT